MALKTSKCNHLTPLRFKGFHHLRGLFSLFSDYTSA